MGSSDQLWQLDVLRRHVEAFDKLNDAVLMPDKRARARAIAMALGSYKAGVRDDFVAKWEVLDLEVGPVMRELFEKYERFEDWSKRQVGDRKFVATADGVRSLLNKVQDNKAKYVDKLSDREPNKRSSGGQRGYYREGSGETYGARLGSYIASHLMTSDITRAIDAALGSQVATELTRELREKKAELSRCTATNRNLDGVCPLLGEFIDATYGPVIARLEEAAEKLGASSDPRLDPKKRSIDDFIAYNVAGDAAFTAAATAGGFALSRPGQNPFDIGSMSAVYGRLGQPLEAALRASVRDVDAALKKLPPPGKVGGAEPERDRLQWTKLRDALNALAGKMGVASMDSKKPVELPALVATFREVKNVEKIGKLVKVGVPAGTSSGSSSASGTSGSSFGLLQDGPGGGPGAAAALGSGDGFMYRSIDKDRVARYVFQLNQFKKSAAEHGLDVSIESAAGSLTARIEEIDKQRKEAEAGGDPLLYDVVRETTTAAKITAFANFCALVKRFFTGYAGTHAAFVNKRHHDAMEYMEYWRSVKHLVPEPELVRTLDEYHETLKEVVKEAGEKMGKARAAVRAEFNPDKLGGLNNEESALVENQFEVVLVWCSAQMDKVGNLYTVGNNSQLLDAIRDPGTQIVYALKAFRLFVAWYALKTAGGVFQGMYDRRVYTEERDPPPPAVFVGLFLAIDAAINILVICALLFLKRMFKRFDNEFPIDGTLLNAWALDYAAVTLLVAVLALIIGEVVRTKKYFRYKYEGDRGIRSMQQMVMYVTCVVMVMPFFRLAYG